MTEMVQPLRKLVGMKKYKGSKKLTWTDEAIDAFHCCRVAVSNCQALYFLEDTVTPILQTDASDYGIGGYLYMIIAGIDANIEYTIVVDNLQCDQKL